MFLNAHVNALVTRLVHCPAAVPRREMCVDHCNVFDDTFTDVGRSLLKRLGEHFERQITIGFCKFHENVRREQLLNAVINFVCMSFLDHLV